MYVGARRHILTKKQRRRQQQVAAGLAPPSQAEVRFSTRRAPKVTSYNEDDDDVFEEDESEMMTPSYYGNGADENLPVIDVVLKHRFKEGIGKGAHANYAESADSCQDGDSDKPNKHDFEFYVSLHPQLSAKANVYA